MSPGFHTPTPQRAVQPRREHRPLRPAALGVRVSAAGLLAALVGCAVGPAYKRPAIDVPTAFRSGGSHSLPSSGLTSLGDLGWQTVLKDPQLQAYVSEALTNSWDIKIAAARVLQAEAAVRITRSQLMPTVAAGADLVTTRASQRGPSPIPAGIDPQKEYGDASLAMASYELDLWGRVRGANEAARATLLATDAAQQTVRQTLVAQVASAYLALLELDHELEIAHRTYGARTNSLTLTTVRELGGVASMQDVHQAQILVSTAEASIADIRRRTEQQENALGLLLGRAPGPLQRGPSLLQQDITALVPPGLPSSLLERRPDIRAAEHQLVAANADVGQARAAFFPKVTLTGLYGYQTVALSDLFSAPARTWQFGPALSVPLFTGGALRGSLKAARARLDEATAAYQKTVQGAFREVSDGLVGYQRTQEFLAHMKERVQAHRSATELANIRYEGGVTSYLEVLYNEQQLFDAELALAQARLNEMLAVVTLYRTLGGGWQPPTPATPPP